MNKGGQALNLEQTLQQNNTDKDFVVSNCGYFIAENSPHTMSAQKIGYLLIYLHKGRVMLPNSSGENEILTSGTVVLFKPHEVPKITYLSDPINERYYVYFEGKSVETCLEKLKINDKRHYTVGDLSAQIKNFHKIIDDYKYHSFDEDVYRSTYLLNILTAIANVVNPSQKSYYPDTFKHILDLIEKSYFEKITLSSLAKSFSISTSTLKRYFNTYMDCSPMEYLYAIRLEKAKFMLLEYDLQISEISYSVGIDDALYFSKFFKSKTGLSPRDFRKKYKPQFDFKK